MKLLKLVRYENLLLLAFAQLIFRYGFLEQQANLPTRVWLVEPNQKPPYTLLMEFPPGPRVRGITWTADGSAVIMGKHDWTSDIVLMQKD